MENENLNEAENHALNKTSVMGSASRIPESFLEYNGEEIMSNFDGDIVSDTAEEIKGKELFSRYASWNFNGKVWWKNNLWNCEIWRNGSYQETFNAEKLNKIMSDVCYKFGYE
jgi:hypothetical protein